MGKLIFIKLLKALGTTSLIMLIVASGAYAYYLLRAIPVHVEILGAPKWLAIYTPPNYDTDAKAIRYAIVQPGTAQETICRLKNEGPEPLEVNVRTVPDNITWADVTFTPADIGILSSNQSINWTMRTYVHPDAPAGNVTFILEFYEP